MNRGAGSSRSNAMRGADLAQSLKADLLTSLNAIAHQSDEGGLEVPCPIAPPMISQPETPNHDLTNGIAAPTMPEQSVQGGFADSSNAAWWDTPVAPAKSWCAPPDCLELLQRTGHIGVELLHQTHASHDNREHLPILQQQSSGHGCVELLQQQHPAHDNRELLQRPPTDCGEFSAHRDVLQRPPTDCVELLQCSPADCVEVFRAHKQARQIPRQIPPRQLQALSANAPEFVPEGSSVVVPASMASSVPLQRSMLEDSIRNILQQGETTQIHTGTVAYVPATAPAPKSTDPDSICCPATVATPPRKDSCSSGEELSKELCHEVAKPATCIRVEDLPDHIPSIGSLNHDSGDCRRCNFFHKGRCQNARSCAFCHFPHEKRKMVKSKEEHAVGGDEESAEIRGAPGLDLPAPLTPRRLPVATGPRPAKVSMGTQTEDDLPPCLLCLEPASAQEMVPPKFKVWKKAIKEDKGTKDEHASHQGNMHVARIGGC